VILINIALFILFVILIKRSKEKEEAVDEPEWKFAHKIERPVDV
jgi:uncharacterized protein YoxC